MLKLQHPYPMSQAASLYRPFDFLPSQSKVQRPLSTLTHPGFGSRHDLSQLPNDSKPCAAPPSTPPSNMSFTSTGQIPHMLNNQRVNDVLRTSSRSQTYLNSSLPHTTTQCPKAAASGPSSPSSQRQIQEPSHRRKTSSNTIASQLQIPKTINTPQLSLLQLAADITCLFWFESSSTLHEILRSGSPRLNLTLCPEAIPTTGFKKWVAMILSTTQVAQNVILLALLFIYRLKKINPGVKGKSGSEYRLLTVALMLGNKFLDDNTYTNKTWAEVSGISVLEVHMMEVEFLQNMKYNLFTSEEEWKEWHVTLGKFGTFFDRASRAHHDGPPRTLGSMTPTVHIPPTPVGTLPSPPTSLYASPPFVAANRFSPSHSAYSTTPLLLPQVTSAAVSPIGPLPELDVRVDSRKRGLDESSVDPPPKRQIRQYTPNMDASSASTIPSSASGPTLPRLPSLPSLSIPVTQNLDVPMPQLVPQLPLPGNRAMSLVYPPPVQWSQPSSVPMLATSGPSTSPASAPLLAPHDQTRQLSPFPTGSVGNSPVSATFPSSQNPGRLSPSYILSQRQSPYRPVRRVNTLLYPPPTTIMQNPPRTISFDQMQYQSLGRNERRPGPLPYMHHEAWPETNQLNQWPILPQPNISRV